MDWEKINYFTKKEWKKDSDKANPRLVKIIDDLRELSGSRIRINVCWENSGHSSKSYHKTGNAVDFVFSGNLSYLEQYSFISMFSELRGIGFYPGWNTVGWHVDLRPEPLRWVRIKGIYFYNKECFMREIRQ